MVEELKREMSIMELVDLVKDALDGEDSCHEISSCVQKMAEIRLLIEQRDARIEKEEQRKAAAKAKEAKARK